jgi:hypothetical protein
VIEESESTSSVSASMPKDANCVVSEDFKM